MKDVVAKTAAKAATGSISATGTQAKRNDGIITINVNNIKIFAGHVVDHKYDTTEINGNTIPVKFWDYANKQLCRITSLDAVAYIVEYIYTDKDGKEVKTRKVLIPGKDGVTMTTREKDGYKNYTIETTYVNKFGVVTPNKKFSWATKLQ